MSLTAIRAKIKETLEAVSGVENVYDLTPWSANRTMDMSLFKDGTSYKGWFINRTSAETEKTQYNTKRKAHIFTITGFMQIDTANKSAHTFNDLLDSVQAAFDVDTTLGGTCESTYATWGTMQGIPGLQLYQISERMIGDVLCYVAECKLFAEEKQ